MTQIFLLSGKGTHVGKALLCEQAIMCTLQESKERLNWLGPFVEFSGEGGSCILQGRDTEVGNWDTSR